MPTVSCPHCRHSREVEETRIPRARLTVKCPGCGERFELDGAALHDAEAPLELDLARMPARPAAPPPDQPLLTGPPPEFATAGAQLAPAPVTPPSGPSARLRSGLLFRVVPPVLLLLVLGRCSVTSWDRPDFLQLRWTGEGASLSRASRVLVFLHGFGGSASDVEWFAEEVVDRSGREDLAVVLPDAPFSRFFGRAWFVTNDPAEREEARARTVELIRDLSTRHGIPADRFYVGGFSQGAGVALQVAQSYPGPLGGAVLLSGCSYPRGELPPMRVLIGHGRKDSVCNFGQAQALATQLTAAGQPVELSEHPGDHVLPETIQTAVAAFLTAGIP